MPSPAHRMGPRRLAWRPITPIGSRTVLELGLTPAFAVDDFDIFVSALQQRGVCLRRRGRGRRRRTRRCEDLDRSRAHPENLGPERRHQHRRRVAGEGVVDDHADLIASDGSRGWWGLPLGQRTGRPANPAEQSRGGVGMFLAEVVVARADPLEAPRVRVCRAGRTLRRRRRCRRPRSVDPRKRTIAVAVAALNLGP